MEKKSVLNKIKDIFKEEEIKENFTDLKSIEKGIFRIESLAIDAEIFSLDEDGVNPAEDGEYVFEDYKIACKDGKISSILKLETPREDTASTRPRTSYFSQAALKPSTSLIRPEPVSQCAIAAHFGLCSLKALSMMSPETDCPCGTLIVITDDASGLREF